MKKIVVYPGSFDPITNGHLDIIDRISKVFDEIYILVSINPNKKYIFSAEERVDFAKKSTSHLKNVKVESSKELVLSFAQEKNAIAIVRGLRNQLDFENEITLFQFNHSINNKIETLLLFPSANNLFLSSSSVKELVLFGNDISNYVHPNIKDEIVTKILERIHK